VSLLWLALGAIAAGVALHVELALFTPVPRRALRVLMYHRVAQAGRAGDRSTVTAAALERQIAWLRARGYTLVSLGDVVRHARDGAPLPDRAVLLSFDDGTDDAHDVLLPLLRRLAAPAAVFVVPGFAGTERPYDGATRRFASASQLRALAEGGVGIGLHTFEHVNLSTMSPEEVAGDVARCARWLDEASVPFEPALAYPYGAYPRKDPTARRALLEALRGAGVQVAFRIGNRVNSLPLDDVLEVQRTEIRGDERPLTFGWKVWKGRRRAFA
jgi:peptidoglycan/xylan/chitin deacetylase (PgdA/CDA1 family)